MNALVELLKEPAFWALAIALATPLLFGVLGAQFCQRAGVINYGAEGLFIAGAFAAQAIVQFGHSPWAGFGAALGSGLCFGLLIGVLSGSRGPAQPLTGIAITLLAVSLTPFSAGLIGVSLTAPTATFAPVDLRELAALPYLGPMLFAQAPPVYLAVLAALACAYLIMRTPFGLAVRACGDNPEALVMQGRSALGVRTAAVMLGSALIAIGGAGFALMPASATQSAQGRGWLCVAIALTVGPRVTLALIVAFLFGMIDAVHSNLGAGARLPAEVTAMLPYILIVIALAAIGQRAAPAPLRAP